MPKKQPPFLDEIESGEQLRGLEALRRKIADAIAECESSRDLAALSRQLVDVMGRIAALQGAGHESEEAGSPLDDLAKRREERRESDAAPSVRTRIGVERS